MSDDDTPRMSEADLLRSVIDHARLLTHQEQP